MKPLPGVWIGAREGAALRNAARAGARAKLVVEGSIEPGVMNNVWGVLPGRSDATIVIASHHDSPFSGASEDGAGMAQVLGQAWSWSQVPKEERPKTLVFVAAAGHFYGVAGSHAFAEAHAELMRRTELAIVLEHLGAKEVRGARSGYRETGRIAFTGMLTTPEPQLIASVLRALERGRPRNVAALPSNLLSEAPTSDAAGYVIEAGVPVVSWIGCPYYLLDEHDTLDKIDHSELEPVARTVTELVKTAMAR
jgi:hypothetical protein